MSSASVFLPLHCRMAELRHRFSANDGGRSPSSVKRNLFGPVDHAENQKFVHDELQSIHQTDTHKWNFDFAAEVPLDGRFVWTPISQVEFVPEAYLMPRLQCLSEPSSPPNVSAVASSVATIRRPIPTTPSPLRPSVGTSTSTPTPATTEDRVSPSKLESVSSFKLESVPSAKVEDNSRKRKSDSDNESNSQTVSPATQRLEEVSERRILITTKQSSITDFLKERKRTSAEGVKVDESSSSSPPPLVKRPKTAS